MRPSATSWPSRRHRSRTFSSAGTPRGISWAASTSTWPRIARTTTRRSRSWPPTPRGSPRTRRRSTCRSARRCASTPARRTRARCCRCCCPSSARPRAAPGSSRWSTRARSSTRCAGRRRRRSACSRTAATRGRRRGRARARAMASRPAAAAAGHRDRGRQAAVSGLGTDALLDFSMEVTLDGERLTAAEVAALLAASRWPAARARPLGRGGSRAAAPRCSTSSARSSARPRRAGSPSPRRCACSPAPTSRATASPARRDRDWSRVAAGPWLAETLAGLRGPDGLARVDPGTRARAPRCGRTSRSASAGCISSRGSAWAPAWPTTWGSARPSRCWRCCWRCRRSATASGAPSLLVAPASLLANWMAEIERFAPSLQALVAHPSAMTADRAARR